MPRISALTHQRNCSGSITCSPAEILSLTATTRPPIAQRFDTSGLFSRFFNTRNRQTSGHTSVPFPVLEFLPQLHRVLNWHQLRTNMNMLAAVNRTLKRIHMIPTMRNVRGDTARGFGENWSKRRAAPSVAPLMFNARTQPRTKNKPPTAKNVTPHHFRRFPRSTVPRLTKPCGHSPPPYSLWPSAQDLPRPYDAPGRCSDIARTVRIRSFKPPRTVSCWITQL